MTTIKTATSIGIPRTLTIAAVIPKGIQQRMAPWMKS